MVVTGLLALGVAGWMAVSYVPDSIADRRGIECANAFVRDGLTDSQVESRCAIWIHEDRTVTTKSAYGPDTTGERFGFSALAAAPFLLVWALGAWVRYLAKA